MTSVMGFLGRMLRMKRRLRHSWKNSFTAVRARERIALAVMIVFLIAQLIWWLVFQRNSIEQTIFRTTVAWTRDARVAEFALNAVPKAQRELTRSTLATEFPHLNFSQSPVTVDIKALESFTKKQISYLRMFTFEGPFFILIILAMLWFVANSLRQERELHRRQSNFLMAASHEFRTPISSLRLLLETSLYRQLTADKQRDYLQRMESELSRLQDASERVLATARLEQGMGLARLEPLNITDVVQKVINVLKPALEAKGAIIKLDLPNNPLFVRLDPTALTLALDNLLENAVKYTPASEKSVLVRLIPETRFVRLEVEDYGIGVNPKDAQHIFDQFYRAGDETTRATRGLGLGLFLVRSIAELLGGTAICRSTRHGSCFIMRLPLSARAAQ